VIRRVSGAADSFFVEVRMIGGDPEDIRHHASTLRGWADSVDDRSRQLRKGEDVEWESTAGDSFRCLLATEVVKIGTVSQRIRDAADELDRLAATLEDRQQRFRAAG
jgi:hypothetical protein